MNKDIQISKYIKDIFCTVTYENLQKLSREILGDQRVATKRFAVEQNDVLKIISIPFTFEDASRVDHFISLGKSEDNRYFLFLSTDEAMLSASELESWLGGKSTIELTLYLEDKVACLVTTLFNSVSVGKTLTDFR